MNPTNLRETILTASIKELIEIENTLADLIALCQQVRANREDNMGILKVVCSYCGNYMGIKSCLKEMDGHTSHGICPSCEKKEHDRITELIKDKKI